MEEIKQLKEAIAKNQERIEETRLMLERLQQNLGTLPSQVSQTHSNETDVAGSHAGE